VIIYVYIFEIVLFTAVILPYFCCDLTRIFLDYFWQNLIDFFLQNHVCRQSTAQGPLEDYGKSGFISSQNYGLHSHSRAKCGPL
jgi:hypothetical protein